MFHCLLNTNMLESKVLRLIEQVTEILFTICKTIESLFNLKFEGNQDITFNSDNKY